jgi:hypothetical protein
MASTLSDPGSLPDGGSNYVTSSPNKVPDVKVNVDGGFAVGNLDTRLSLTGDNIISLTDKPAQDSDQSDIPTASPFKVKPSDIKGLEKKILTELDSQVGEYESFKKLITDTEGWIFLVQNPGALVPHEQATPTGYTSLSAGYAPPTTKANFTDPDPESTQKIVNSQNALVRALGDAYQLVGEMAAVLNNAAQNYVHADKATFGDGTNVDQPAMPGGYYGGYSGIGTP